MNNFNGAKIAYVVFALIIVSLVINIAYIGITGKHLISGNDIETYAQTRGTEYEVEYAARGNIYSEDGEIIATNVKKYNLVAFLDTNRKGINNKPAYVQNIEETATTLAPLLNMEVSDLQARLQNAVDSGKYQVEFGKYSKDLSSDVKNKIEATGLTGLEFVSKTARNYPIGDFASYEVGYAKNKTAQELVGEMGLEAVFNKELSGENGYKLYQVDASKYMLPNGLLKEKNAVNGNDLYLTFNADLQRDLNISLQKTVDAISATSASCVIMEAKTGRILAASNYPSFDLNQRNIEKYEDFFLDVPFECGSVFKPFVYASTINDGKYPNVPYLSGKYDVYNGKTFAATVKDWNNGEGWGNISFNEGLYRSSNVAICQLLDNYTDKNVLISDLDKLGFYKEGTIDGLSTAAGVAGFSRQSSNNLEYLTSGFGQGSTVTMFQLLRAYSAFANDGKTVEPYFVDRVVNPTTDEVVYQAAPKYSEQIFSSSTVSQVKDLLLGAIEDSTAAAKAYRLTDSDIRIIGKTGTGQISAGKEGYTKDAYSYSFAGMAPYDDPEIIIYLALQAPSTAPATKNMAVLVKEMFPTALAIKSSYNESQDDSSLTYTMDSFTNQSVNFVKSKLEANELVVQVIGNGTTVVDQFPSSKKSVNKHDRIFLKTDSTEITMPNMQGWSRKDASTFASLSGIILTFEGQSGVVSNQSIPAGQLLHAGDNVNIILK